MNNMSPNQNSVSLVVNTFCSDASSGSKQYLHFFSDRDGLLQAFNDSMIDDEFDHSFITQTSKDSFYVLWKNKAGAIQFCGSAAYSLTWLMTQYFGLDRVAIDSESIRVIGENSEAGPALKIPSIVCEQVSSSDKFDHFMARDSGIHLLQLKRQSLLQEASFIEDIHNQAESWDVHGLCLFYWDSLISNGFVRYFVPWHGRDEDYVTGSIHQFLTPLVYRLTGCATQLWQQVSGSSGILNSFFDGDSLTIKGQCSLNNQSAMSLVYLEQYLKI